MLLYGSEGLRGQELKAQLERHYDRRLEPRGFYGSLEALVDAGHVDRSEAGIHEIYSLTEAGRNALETHYEWMRESIETRDPGSK